MGTVCPMLWRTAVGNSPILTFTMNAMDATDSWKTENSVPTQTTAGLLMVGVGLWLVYGFRHHGGPVMSDSFAGYLLGWMVLALGVTSLTWGGKVVVTVDGRRRCVVVEARNRFRTRRTTFLFKDVARESDVFVRSLGDRINGSMSYHVVVRLRSGEEVALFYPFFSGQNDRQVAETRCLRLRAGIFSSGTAPPVS